MSHSSETQIKVLDIMRADPTAFWTSELLAERLGYTKNVGAVVYQLKAYNRIAETYKGLVITESGVRQRVPIPGFDSTHPQAERYNTWKESCKGHPLPVGCLRNEPVIRSPLREPIRGRVIQKS